jgi:hypothetical protein
LKHPEYKDVLTAKDRRLGGGHSNRAVDVALLKLARPSLQGFRFARMDAEPVAPGQPLLIVGYGRHDGDKLDTNARMTMLTAGSALRPYGIFQALDEFDVGIYGKLGGCGGDSGGPVFSIASGIPMLVGIMVGGSDKKCGGRTVVTTIEHNHTWIAATAIELGSRLGQ